MKRFILTGAPGSGKTSILEALKIQGYCTIDEAATDVITQEQIIGNNEPWKSSSFIKKIIDLQKVRQLQTESHQSILQFYDRSQICTYALALYLGFKPSKYLTDEIYKIKANEIYQKQVFFIKNLGFIKNTEARQISFEESLKFEKMHIIAYEKFGYNLVYIQPDTIIKRVENIINHIEK